MLLELIGWLTLCTESNTFSLLYVTEASGSIDSIYGPTLIDLIDSLRQYFSSENQSRINFDPFNVDCQN